ncbi:ABC transporter ATP-binding protein [Pararhodobacter zhoushanensis]|uniref:ABC transporter ATP-binding protein n=1 Tax=Pararhodobacter zhoushanensis TaxID=2479545 RepID=UPI000F8C553B|nr:ABC transporter ATP-binding protein [Pararhodobacter zhoushanensis]
MFKFFETLVDPYVAYRQDDTPPRKLLPFLLEYARPFRKVFVVTIIASMLVAFAETGLLWYLGRVVDLMGTSDAASFWQTHALELLLAALFLLLIRPVMQAIDVGLINNAILPNFGTLIRWRAHRQVMRQSVGWFENDFAGRIANRIMQTPPAAGEAVFQIFDALTYSVAYIIGAGVLLAGADVQLLLPLLVWLALYLMLVRWTVKRIGPASMAASDARSAVNGRVVDAYSNIHSVKLFAQQELEFDHAREAIENARQTFNREMRLFTIMDLCLVTLNGLLIVSVVGWGLWLWSTGAASVGIVAAASALVLRLNAMTGWLMWAVSSFFRNMGVVAEGMETIAQPISLTDVPGAKPLVFADGKIELDNVSHHYGRGSGGLQALSLTIKPGEKIGVIGRSGAGKSTLVKLLLRFYDPEGGRILIDGQDITHVQQDSLRAQIGMVQQDTALLHRSVRENILYGRGDATEAEMIEAAKRAEAHDFIEALGDAEGRTGYDVRVGERGVKLSGGQRQRIAIARVILKDAPVLVLDEATSALDSEVEASIQETLYGMMEGKTVIAIAHRLSTIARMDRIVVLDDGRVVEEGNHAELLAQGGLYARFWERQSGGFIGTDD